MARIPERVVPKEFPSLRKRLDVLERRYNPDEENLHFACFSYADANLYPELVSLAEDGVKAVKRHHVYFANRSLYADDYYWYNLFLAISAAANRVRKDNAQSYIPEGLVNKLVKLLIQIGRYSTIRGGDITKRNYEALGNTVLAFYTEDRVRAMLRQAKTLPAEAKRVVQEAIETVKQLRSAERTEKERG